MPKTHFDGLKKLVKHFTDIIAASETTKMNAVNLSTCIGTTLLHSEGKSIANVMEIKFVNQIVLIILNNYDRVKSDSIFCLLSKNVTAFLIFSYLRQLR